jgi:integrase
MLGSSKNECDDSVLPVFSTNNTTRTQIFVELFHIPAKRYSNKTTFETRSSYGTEGIKYILECCCSLFNFAKKHRYLSPYAENPFSALDLDRIPIENVNQVTLFNEDQERAFLQTCDEWLFPVFATLMMTGLRPGELTHLLLLADLDLKAGLLRVRNKPELNGVLIPVTHGRFR